MSASPSLLALAAAESALRGIPAGLLEGLIQHESGWATDVIGQDANGSVDRGIVQINSAAHPDVSAAQALDPTFAIPWAAAKLSSLAGTCGSWEGALSAYNSGACGGDAAYVSAVTTAARGYGYKSGTAAGGGTSTSSGGGIPAWGWGLGLALVVVAMLAIL